MEKLCINKVIYYLISYLTIQNVVGVGKVQKKFMQRKGNEEKKKENRERRSKEKNSCRVNSSVRLRKFAGLKDTLAATLYLSFLGPGGIPDSTDFLCKLLEKFSLSRLIHFGAATSLLWIYFGSLGLKATEPCAI